MSDDSHEVYKELSSAINDLSKDMVKGLVSLRAVAGDNKADIERLEKRLERFQEDVSSKIEELRRKEAVAEERVKTLSDRVKKGEEGETRRSAQGAALQTENTKGRWAFWVAVASGAAGVLSTLANFIAHALGWT